MDGGGDGGSEDNRELGVRGKRKMKHVYRVKN